MERISKLEDTARKALDIGLQNANVIKKMDEQQDRMRKEISTTLKAEIKKELLLEITKLQAQMKVTLIELEDLRNRSMRSTLIFKNIPGIQNKLWEDTSWLLADFINVNWISHILLKKLIFKSSEPIEALHKTRAIQTKINEVQSRYLPNWFTRASPKKSEMP